MVEHILAPLTKVGEIGSVCSYCLNVKLTLVLMESNTQGLVSTVGASEGAHVLHNP